MSNFGLTPAGPFPPPAGAGFGGGSGGAPSLILQLNGTIAAPTLNVRITEWSVTAQYDSGDGAAEWNSSTMQLKINTAGVYLFDLQGVWTSAQDGNFWDTTSVNPFGFTVDGALIMNSLHSRVQPNSNFGAFVDAQECWTDRFTRVCAAGDLITITMWYDKYFGDNVQPTADAILIVTRAMDAP